MSDEFDDVLSDMLETDAEVTGGAPVAFLHGVLDENGTVGTISGSRIGSLSYEQKLSILAALIAEVESVTEHSAEDVFRDLVARRNQMSESGGSK